MVMPQGIISSKSFGLGKGGLGTLVGVGLGGDNSNKSISKVNNLSFVDHHYGHNNLLIVPE